MSNLNTFVNKQLFRASLHANARYLFDWPGVMPSIDTEATTSERFGRAIVQNIEIGGTDHNELSLVIDGHSIPVLSTPKLATTMGMTLMLDNHILDGTYGKLLDMMYLSDAYGTADGLNMTNYKNPKQTTLARLYLLNENYAGPMRTSFSPLNSPSIVIHYPRVKSVGGLTFDSMTADVSKCHLELVFAWYDKEPGK